MNIKFLIKNAISNLNSLNSIKIRTTDLLDAIVFKCYNTIIPFIKPIINKIVNHKNLNVSIINIKNQNSNNIKSLESDTVKIEKEKTKKITIKDDKAYAIKASINNDVKKYIVNDVKENLKSFKKLEVNDIEKINTNIIANVKNINIIPSLQEVYVLLNLDKTKTKPIDVVLDSNIEKLAKAIVDPMSELIKDINKNFIIENIKMDIKNYLNKEISLIKISLNKNS